jgi:hypothetical protein
MRVEDGGASFSLVIYDQRLTFDNLDILKKLDGVEKVLVSNDTFTVTFRVDSFLDITPSTVINAQQAIKKTFRNITRVDCPAGSVPIDA